MKIATYMWGALARVVAISAPQVRSVVPERIRPSEKTERAKPDGLKMCRLRPSRFQRKNSLPRMPTAIIVNCR